MESVSSLSCAELSYESVGQALVVQEPLTTGMVVLYGFRAMERLKCASELRISQANSSDGVSADRLMSEREMERGRQQGGVDTAGHVVLVRESVYCMGRLRLATATAGTKCRKLKVPLYSAESLWFTSAWHSVASRAPCGPFEEASWRRRDHLLSS